MTSTKEPSMPTYEYECEKCGHIYSLTLSLREREKLKPRCPKCKSTKSRQVLSTFHTVTSKKS
jgi:putative FmdB family regulatory protein